jgi:hypothetical protein
MAEIVRYESATAVLQEALAEALFSPWKMGMPGISCYEQTVAILSSMDLKILDPSGAVPSSRTFPKLAVPKAIIKG